MSRKAAACLFLFLMVLVSAPLFLVSHPPLHDYPNHLARSFLILNQDDPVLRQFYNINWVVVPNLAMDIIVPALAQIMPVALAGKFFIVLIFFLTASGSLHLHYALHRRLSAVPFLAFLFLYNACLMMGFLNFLFGCGLMLHALALWIRLEARPGRQLALGFLACLLLFFTHLYIVALYGLFLFLYENQKGAKDFMRRNIRLGLPFLLPALLLLFFSPTGAQKLSAFGYTNPLTKIAGLGEIVFFSYATPLNLALLLLLINVLPLLCAPQERKKIILLMLAGLTLFLLTPKEIMSSANADWRVLIPFIFIIIAIAHSSLQKKGQRVLIIFIALMTAAQMAALYPSWRLAQKNYDDFTQVIAAAEPGDTLFPALVYDTPSLENPDAESMSRVRSDHIFCYGVMEKKLFIPSLFSVASQQPLRFTPAAEAIVPREPNGIFATRYKKWTDIDWDQAAPYDGLVVMAREDNPPVPARWQLVSAKGFLRFYRNTEPSPAAR